MQVVTGAQVAALCDSARSQGKKIGYTSGIFDLLHHGHVDYLQKARDRCDVLVVGVNSDRSTSTLKGPLRPIVTDSDRLAVIKSLKSVDLAFIFDELTNGVTIELLKPDFYFKAGDYDKAKLSSAPLVEAYGGKVELIPFLPGCSTTSLVERIQGRIETLCLPQPSRTAKPAVFLDRDGTLIELVEYLHEPKKVRLLDGVGLGLKRLQDAGYFLVVTTNQAGIGLGYFTKEQFFSTNLEFLRQVSSFEVAIDKIYFSPYGKADASPCRKPNIGMIHRAQSELPVIMEQSIVVGDSTLDIQFASNAGLPSVLVASGKGGNDGLYSVQPSVTVEHFSDAVTYILGRAK